MSRRLLPILVRVVIIVAWGLAGWLPAGPATAQVADGATLTVLRGQVALIQASGAVIQPAPSGTTVSIGDEIRTLNATGALITFYAGTEIELGPHTTLVVQQIALQGGRVDIALKQVFGTSLSRVQTLSDPSSAYRVEAGGAVALVRGSTLAVRGPETTPTGTYVSMVCLDCGGQSYVQDLQTGEQEPLGPQERGYTWGVASRGGGPEKRGDFDPFKVERAMGPVGSAVAAITTAEHNGAKDAGQGPPGRNPLGQHRDRGGREGPERRDRRGDSPPHRPRVPAIALTCSNTLTNGICVLTAQTDPGANAQFDVLARQGPNDVVETGYTCGPAGPNGLLTCIVNLTGKAFHFGHVDLEMTFPDGGHETIAFPLRCGSPIGPGILC